MSLNIVLFMSTVREGRMCSRVTNFIKNLLENKNHVVTVFDPLEMDFPMVKKPIHFHGPNEVPPDWLVKCNAQIEAADAFVVISGEYNRCIPPALTSMMDHFPPQSYRCRPCSIVCYSMGSAGGCVAGMQLRYFLGELGMVTPGYIFEISYVHTVFTEDGTPTKTNSTTVSKGKRLVSELEWYATALKTQTLKSPMTYVKEDWAELLEDQIVAPK